LRVSAELAVMGGTQAAKVLAQIELHRPKQELDLMETKKHSIK
jgi:acetyl-CoA carboxylase carboxyltransferase component